MSECILCQVRRAEHPLYIESVGLNLYSIEELMYFMTNNLPLLDEEILNDRLLQWLKDELRLKRMVQNLRLMMQGQYNVRDLLVLIYRECGYPDAAVLKGNLRQLAEFQKQPVHERMKRKGDTLIKNARYLKAIEIYQQVLELKNTNDYGAQYMGIIYNNIGYAYSKLFQFEEAVMYFKQANEILHSRASLKSYLFAVYMKDGEEAYQALAEAEGLDPDTREEMDQEIAQVEMPETPVDLKKTIQSWVKQYHKDTGN